MTAPIIVEVSDIIKARPEDIYAVLSDYRVGHPAILPKPYFEELTVEQGGQGAGTVYRLRMKVMGQTFHYRHTVSEPEPGRVLVETDLDTGQGSRFTLEPLDSGNQTRVTITAQFPPSPGFKGFMERLINPPLSRRMFRQELRNLEQYILNKSTQLN